MKQTYWNTSRCKYCGRYTRQGNHVYCEWKRALYDLAYWQRKMLEQDLERLLFGKGIAPIKWKTLKQVRGEAKRQKYSLIKGITV